MMPVKKYKGEIFGTLEVTKDLGMRFATQNSKKRTNYIEVKCIKCDRFYVDAAGDIKKLSKKCICQHTYGRKHWHRIKDIWNKMIVRCLDKNNFAYKNYGGRGITICDEWKDSAEIFYKWALESGYQDNLSIDRIDNNKGYNPDNCRWATAAQQNRNKPGIISVEKVKEIKRLLKAGYTHKIIANMCETTLRRVAHISAGDCWVDIII